MACDTTRLKPVVSQGRLVRVCSCEVRSTTRLKPVVSRSRKFSPLVVFFPNFKPLFLSDINLGKQKGGFSYVSNTNPTKTSCNRLQRLPQREELLVEDFRN